MKREFKGKEKYGNWTLLSRIDGGGNGEVWVCRNAKGEKRAIKLLKKQKTVAYQRFIDEVTVTLENDDINGVIKTEEQYLPKDFNKNVPFYVMPLGEAFEKKIKDKSFEEKIDVIIKIAECLTKLHDRGISHRDIKPSNLLFLNEEPTLIDFGLANFPDKADITKNKEKIGPRWTMAPEINRQTGEKIDYFKADVYSLAKTLWITLTGVSMGFEGQYNIDTILQVKNKFPNEYTTPIDNLLRDCTDNDPHNRPTMKEFLSRLWKWKRLNEDFHLQNNEQWAEVLNKIFPLSIPQRAIWEEIDDIIQILQILGTTPNLNHLFFPESGGLDLKNARRSVEEGCIELDFVSIYIVKPKRLIFESFGADANWNYFRLETGGLKPSGVYSNERLKGKIREDVSETYPGKYEDYDIAENRSYYRERGYDVPIGTRHVMRYFEGSFVIFNKRSPYNLDASTYDGRHNEMTTDEFREYIQRNIVSIYPPAGAIKKLLPPKVATSSLKTLS